jgi:hypothetical protein
LHTTPRPGGLSARKQNLVLFFDAHIVGKISLARLAKISELSRYHFALQTDVQRSFSSLPRGAPNGASHKSAAPIDASSDAACARGGLPRNQLILRVPTAGAPAPRRVIAGGTENLSLRAGSATRSSLLTFQDSIDAINQRSAEKRLFEKASGPGLQGPRPDAVVRKCGDKNKRCAIAAAASCCQKIQATHPRHLHVRDDA